MATSPKSKENLILAEYLERWATDHGVLNDPYVVGLGNALVDSENLAMWASIDPTVFLPHPKVRTEDEARKLIAGYTDLATLRTNGGFIAKEKYMILRGDERSIYLKKGAGGAALVKTNQCFILAVYVEGQVAGACNSAAEKLAVTPSGTTCEGHF